MFTAVDDCAEANKIPTEIAVIYARPSLHVCACVHLFDDPVDRCKHVLTDNIDYAPNRIKIKTNIKIFLDTLVRLSLPPGCFLLYFSIPPLDADQEKSL